MFLAYLGTLAARLQDDTPLALLLLDLGRFKEINDTLGHPVGDAILCEVAQRLESVLEGQPHLAARLGGDEFTLLLTGVQTAEALRACAERLLDRLSRPFEVQGLQLELDASIGIAIAPRDGTRPSELLRAADVAMYQAKRRGVRIEFYDPARDQHSPQRLALMAELGGAIEAGQLELHYQPKLDLASGRVCGVEALVRWRHPRHGLLMPALFLPYAEVSEVIHPLTLAVIRQALTQQERWWRSYGWLLPVAVNLSARNLLDERFAHTLPALLAEHATPGTALVLEITETALMHDPEHSAQLLERIADMGVAVAIDDFGTGYSSLAYLRRLPVCELKIDRVFVKDMCANRQDYVIVRSTIDLAHNLGLQVVAEGVEDNATLALLVEMGCDRAQGYHYARPMPAQELEHWLQGRVVASVHPVPHEDVASRCH
ncbi:MAG: bifunctional diguanylate cyclase/phosphodiesterase [Thiobacillaceae bacterium]|nr:bifunctional diguanylate cyclase/phosphodiesterase [Thiobacillaceae bacterium]